MTDASTAPEPRGATLLLTGFLTSAAMIAFAANSVLCRLALAEGDADAGAFTMIRIASGAAVLALLVSLRSRATGWSSGTWTSAAALATYALGFSVAYRQLGAGTGALILFAAVQATMIGWGLYRGERPRPMAWTGVVIAATGATWLLLPGATAPAPLGAALMTGAGIAWGIYSLRARGVIDPIAATAGNFLRATVLVVPAAAWFVAGVPTPKGWLVAIVSGAVTSGLGYVIWYAALPRLTATAGAAVQLTVPALAALGGVLLLGETLTARLAGASLTILGGVLLVVVARSKAR